MSPGANIGSSRLTARDRSWTLAPGVASSRREANPALRTAVAGKCPVAGAVLAVLLFRRHRRDSLRIVDQLYYLTLLQFPVQRALAAQGGAAGEQ